MVENRSVGPAHDAAASAMGRDGGSVTVRYWAGARAAAGRDADEVAAGDVAAALDAVRGEHPGLGPVLEVATLLLDGRTVGPEHPLSAGDVLEILPPFAGG